MDTIDIALLAGDTTARSIFALLQPHSELNLSFSTTSSEELLQHIGINHPPVILLESATDLPDVIPLLSQLQLQQPRSHCLILTRELDLEHAHKALSTGAKGYLLIESNLEALVAAVPLVRAGKLTLSPQIARLLISLP